MPVAAAEAKEEQTEPDVILTSAGDNKVNFIKEISAIPDLGAREEKDLVSSAHTC
jgi:large subunit ribosomal protein L7/L12